MKVLGISGSLRKGSYNTALLQVAQELAPAEMEIEIFDLSPIPLFNADLEAQGLPEIGASVAPADRRSRRATVGLTGVQLFGDGGAQERH